VRTVAVLPIKTFQRAKQRLGAAVGAAERSQLAYAMATDVLEALQAVPELASLVVVTSEPRAAAAARAAGATIVHDCQEAGQSAAAMSGIPAGLAMGAERVLLIPGDCPALDPAELSGLLLAPPAGPREVVIVPDRHGTGTNALLLTPPRVIVPAFGTGSRRRHEELAAEAGAQTRVQPLASLALDVDTPDDLDALRVALAGLPKGAPATRAALARLLAPA
jgi:2-phospho-L-lactate guanylyltransferase